MILQVVHLQVLPAATATIARSCDQLLLSGAITCFSQCCTLYPAAFLPHAVLLLVVCPASARPPRSLPPP